MCLLAAVHLQRMRQLGGIGGPIAQQLQQQRRMLSGATAAAATATTTTSSSASVVTGENEVVVVVVEEGEEEEEEDQASFVNDELVDQLLSLTQYHLEQNMRDVTEGDAMAGLHVVSGYLFMGGQGHWGYFLEFSRLWVDKVLRDKRYRNPSEAYRHCSASAKFIIRTTMWFDVWSAITGKAEPHFKDIYRELFDGEHGYNSNGQCEVDMLAVMGCTNETVLAMSEIAVLACWKDAETKQGGWSFLSVHGESISNVCVSLFFLRNIKYAKIGGTWPNGERGIFFRGGFLSLNVGPFFQIEKRYLSREHDATLLNGVGDHLDTRRRLAANVFRSSARVYLHSVLSGCMPQVEEIYNAVEETVKFLKMIPTSAGASGSVIRSVVYVV